MENLQLDLQILYKYFKIRQDYPLSIKRFFPHNSSSKKRWLACVDEWIVYGHQPIQLSPSVRGLQKSSKPLLKLRNWFVPGKLYVYIVRSVLGW